MANMFDKAKSKTTTAAAKKNEKISVNVKGADFDKAVKIAAENDTKIKELKAELDIAKATIVETAKEKFADLYDYNKRNIGSFNLISENGGSFMFLPTKRYIKVTDDRVDHLKETYGTDVIEENTTYGFNPSILEKHMNDIAELLMSAEFLTDEEKDALIEAQTDYSVNKDVLDNFYVMKVEKGVEIEDCIEDFNPVCQIKYLKAPKVVKK